MLDLHCHLLPGLDDGAQSIEQSIDMARALVELGFDEVVATPHLPGYGLAPLSRATIEECFTATRTTLHEAGIELTLTLGAEHSLEPYLLDLPLDEFLPLGMRPKGTLLVEHPWQTAFSPYLVQTELERRGFTLLIAHPERSGSVDLDELDSLVKAGGVYVQMELGSFAGLYGASATRRAKELIERKLVHAVATDLHAASDAALLGEALERMHAQWGDDCMQLMLRDNPRALLTANYQNVRRLA
jgi:protein-tyrosine phosphatase